MNISSIIIASLAAIVCVLIHVYYKNMSYWRERRRLCNNNVYRALSNFRAAYESMLQEMLDIEADALEEKETNLDTVETILRNIKDQADMALKTIGRYER